MTVLREVLQDVTDVRISDKASKTTGRGLAQGEEKGLRGKVVDAESVSYLVRGLALSDGERQ
jgi:hypothetical protein